MVLAPSPFSVLFVTTGQTVEWESRTLMHRAFLYNRQKVDDK